MDILVNNAGILILNPVENFDLADFERIFAVNVRSVFVGVQAVLPHMGEGSPVISARGALPSVQSGPARPKPT